MQGIPPQQVISPQQGIPPQQIISPQPGVGQPQQGFTSQQIIGGQVSQGGVATPFGQPAVHVGPPSESAKIIGILIMVYGGFTLIGGIFSAVGGPIINQWLSSIDPESQVYASPDWVYIVQGVSGLIAGAAYLFAGSMVKNYEKRGIYFTWAILGISFIFGIIITAAQPYPDVEGIESGSVQLMAVGSAAIGGLCGAGICGLLTAIPLFSANHGLR